MKRRIILTNVIKLLCEIYEFLNKIYNINVLFLINQCKNTCCTLFNSQYNLKHYIGSSLMKC